MSKQATIEEPRVQCIASFAVALKGGSPQGVSVRQGDVLLASAPEVRACPLYFVDIQATTEEILAAQDRIGARSRI